MVYQIVTQSEEETHRLAMRLATRLRGGDFLALDGPLGAGKTCFVRGLAEGLGLDPAEVSSPTFIICQEYGPRPPDSVVGPRSARPRNGDEPPKAEALRAAGADLQIRGLTLAHLDGYRLSSPDELDTIGFDELLSDADTVVAVEWAERFGDRLPEIRIDIAMAHVDETCREITINVPMEMMDRVSQFDSESGAPECFAGGSGGTRGSGGHECPICAKAVDRESETYPFCSSRCRLVDLGKWFGGEYRLDRPLEEDDLEL